MSNVLFVFPYQATVMLLGVFVCERACEHACVRACMLLTASRQQLVLLEAVLQGQ